MLQAKLLHKSTFFQILRLIGIKVRRKSFSIQCGRLQFYNHYRLTNSDNHLIINLPVRRKADWFILEEGEELENHGYCMNLKIIMSC